MPKIIELPDGEEVEFPDEMGDDDIRAILQKKFGAPSPFPGMPKSLQPDQPTDFTKPLPVGGSITNIADFQRQQNEREVPPPPMLRRDPSQPEPTDAEALFRDSLSRAGSFGTTPTQEDIRAGREANIPAMTVAAPALMAGGAALGATRLFGAGVGGYSGYKRGGIPGALAGAASGVALPATTGGIAGALEGYETGGVPGAVLGGALGSGGKIAPVLRGGKVLAEGKSIADAVKAAVTAEKAGAAAVAARTASRGRTTMATNLGGKARPGPAATKPQDIESALKASIEKARVSKEMGPRVREGAERVGRAVGKSKEQVRMETGPVFNEKLGEASPFLPSRVEQDIIDKMRSMPPGEMRKAYVLAAKDPKTQVIAEQMRRFMERVGIAVPIVAGAGVMAAGQE